MEGPVTQDTIVKKLSRLSPEGLAEVARFIDGLQARKRAGRRRQPSAERKYPGFGIWADRKGITDPIGFTSQLRRAIETRQDGELRGE